MIWSIKDKNPYLVKIEGKTVETIGVLLQVGTVVEVTKEYIERLTLKGKKYPHLPL